MLNLILQTSNFSYFLFGRVIIGIDGQIKKCDLCYGDPLCVKNCELDALQFIEATAINFLKRKAAAQRFSELMQKLLFAF